MVKRSEFRSDLYYRLNVFPIPLPPLRARREDIPALVEHFVEIYSRRMDKQIENIPPETMSALVSYQWPGNIRELQNFIERSVILSSGNVLRPPLASLKAAAETESLEAITYARFLSKPGGLSPVRTGPLRAWESRGPRFISACKSWAFHVPIRISFPPS